MNPNDLFETPNRGKNAREEHNESSLQKLWERLSAYHITETKEDLQILATRLSLDAFKESLIRAQRLEDSQEPTKNSDIGKLDQLLTEFHILNTEIYLGSKKELFTLASDTEPLIEFKRKSWFISQLPNELVFRSMNPKNMGDHITGFCLGASYSGEMILRTTYDIGMGLIKLPHDLYRIARKEAVYSPKFPV